MSHQICLLPSSNMETVPDGSIEDGSLSAGELILLELAVAVDVGAS